MKVKLLIPICCPNGSFKAGETPDIDNTVAKGLIDGGYAVCLDKPVISKEVVIPVAAKPEAIKKPLHKK